MDYFLDLLKMLAKSKKQIPPNGGCVMVIYHGRICKEKTLTHKPISSMQGKFTHSWIIVMVNVGKYTIDGLIGKRFETLFKDCQNNHSQGDDSNNLNIPYKWPYKWVCLGLFHPYKWSDNPSPPCKQECRFFSIQKPLA